MSKFIQVNGEKIHIEHFPGTNGKHLVALHPALAQAAFYTMPGPFTVPEEERTSLVAELSKLDFNIITVDFPNHGQSEGVSRTSIEQFADFTDELVKSLQREGIVGRKISLLGWSKGGTTAYELASRNPEWLESVVMLSSSNRWEFGPLPFTQEEYDAGHTDRQPSNTEEAYIMTFLNTSKAFLPPFSSCAGDWKACSDYDGRDKLEQITIPVLHCWGDLDELGAHNKNIDIESANRSNFLANFYEGTTHNLPAEKPKELALDISEFVHHGIYTK